MSADLQLTALRGLPELTPAHELAHELAAALARAGQRLQAGDVLVIAQKAISKVEGREVELSSVTPTDEALAYAAEDGGDARLVELVLRESARIVRRRGSLVIAETHHGHVCASAGVDRSNTSGHDRALLLPLDPDASARRLRAALGGEVAIVISDSHGRPFRDGCVGVALGVAGFEPRLDMRGSPDDGGRAFHSTRVHIADQLASAAELLMGPAGRVPAVLIRGAPLPPGDGRADATAIPAERDLFR